MRYAEVIALHVRDSGCRCFWNFLNWGEALTEWVCSYDGPIVQSLVIDSCLLGTDLGIPFGIFENDTQNRSHQTNFTPIFWVPFFLNETVTFAFVIHKAWQNYSAPGIQSTRTSLYNTLVQHSILYYLVWVCTLRSRHKYYWEHVTSIFVTYFAGLAFLLEIDNRVNMPVSFVVTDFCLRFWTWM